MEHACTATAFRGDSKVGCGVTPVLWRLRSGGRQAQPPRLLAAPGSPAGAAAPGAPRAAGPAAPAACGTPQGSAGLSVHCSGASWSWPGRPRCARKPLICRDQMMPQRLLFCEHLPCFSRHHAAPGSRQSRLKWPKMASSTASTDARRAARLKERPHDMCCCEACHDSCARKYSTNNVTAFL